MLIVLIWYCLLAIFYVHRSLYELKKTSADDPSNASINDRINIFRNRLNADE